MSNPSLVVKADAQTVVATLQEPLPVLIWLSPNGESPTTDVNKALETVATKYDTQLKVLAVTNTSTELKERFDVGSRPLLVGWYNGEIVSRRQRPWATDVQGAADTLVKLLPEDLKNKEEKPVNNKPVNVTDATFEDDVLKSELPVVVDFWAEWCGPCRMVAPILDKLAGEFAGKIRIAKVDVDANPALSQAFRIQSIPTMMFVKQGKIVGQTVGALPEASLRNVIDQLIALEIPA